MSASTMTNMIQTQGLASSSSMRIEEETMMLMQKNQGIVTILGDTYTASAPSLRRTLSADMSSKKWLCPQNDSSPTMKKIASSDELSHHHPKTIANSSSSSLEGEEEEDYEERKELDAEAEAEAEAERERLEIWSSIQRNKKEEQEKSRPFDTWGSIMSLKGNNNNNLEISKSLPVTLTPYVHPLVKRSKSSLSEKSLEICTESLGSETGSDGLLFSSPYPSSESGESDKDKEEEQQLQEEEEEEEKVKVSESACEEWLLRVPRYNNHVAATTKSKSSPRSFPPPLPSLSFQANNKGTSLHMRPHRDNGRLVLEAVSLPSQNNFNAQRHDGRLVLTFTNDAADEVEEENYDDDEGVEEELEEEFEGFEGEEKEDEDEYECEYDDDESGVEESESEVGDDVESVMEKVPLLSSGISTASAHRLALMMNNKPIGLVNRNPNWSEKFNNKGVNLEDVSVVEMEPSEAVAQSLPPRARVARLIPSAAQAVASAASAAAAAAGSFNFNAYEYYWRTKPTSKLAQVPNPLAHQQNNNNNNNNNSPHKSNNSSKAIVSGGDMNQIYNEQQQLLVLRGKNGDYLVHNLKSCKDSRRSFLFWEPYCIATS